MDNTILSFLRPGSGSLLTRFPAPEQEKIKNVLGNGGYYPQEALSRTELGAIWRNTSWN